MNTEERENYSKNDQHSQDDVNQYRESDLDSDPLDNAVTYDEENINQTFNGDDFEEEETLDDDADIDEEDPLEEDPLEEDEEDEEDEGEEEEGNMERQDFDGNNLNEDDFDNKDPQHPHLF